MEKLKIRIQRIRTIKPDLFLDAAVLIEGGIYSVSSAFILAVYEQHETESALDDYMNHYQLWLNHFAKQPNIYNRFDNNSLTKDEKVTSLLLMMEISKGNRL